MVFSKYYGDNIVKAKQITSGGHIVPTGHHFGTLAYTIKDIP